MSKLDTILGRRFPEIPSMPDEARPLPHASIGIEVELENISRDRVEDGKRWRIYGEEGSIIRGVEFISDPIWGTGIRDALEELDTMLAGLDPYVSQRGSVHVHLNMLDMETSALAHLLTLYIMYEPALFRLHDNWNRVQSPFCFPVQSSIQAQKGIALLLKDLSKNRPVINGSYIGTKYVALNPNNLRSLGTLEFRHMGATTDMQAISNWVDTLLTLKRAAIHDVPTRNHAGIWGPYAEQMALSPDEQEAGANTIASLNLWR